MSTCQTLVKLKLSRPIKEPQTCWLVVAVAPADIDVCKNTVQHTQIPTSNNDLMYQKGNVGQARFLGNARDNIQLAQAQTQGISVACDSLLRRTKSRRKSRQNLELQLDPAMQLFHSCKRLTGSHPNKQKLNEHE
jgi:hypothetical protein